MKTLLLILSLLLITTNVYAEWTFYGKNLDGDIWFYDNSTVKRNGDKVRVWKYTNYSPNDEEAKSVNMISSRALHEIDCVNETFKVISLQSFTKPNLQGDMRDITRPNPTTTYIPPDSPNAVLMKLVCKK